MYNNINGFANPQSGLVIEEALFFETGTYNDMTMRPYETQLTGRDVRVFNEVTGGGQHISPEVLSDAAVGFLKPSATARGIINIENGWSSSRFRFTLKVRVGSGFALPVIKIIQGYTNYAGANLSGAVDPNLVLYFNNVITLRSTEIENNHGRSIVTSVGEANQIIRGDFTPFSFSNHHQANDSGNTYCMRPEDVFSKYGKRALADTNDGEFIDYSACFVDMPVKKSRRTNNSAPHYLSGVIDSYKRQMDFYNESSNPYGVTELYRSGEVHSASRGLIKESAITGDAFFEALINSGVSFIESGSVTYGELCGIFPELDRLAEFKLAKAVQRSHGLLDNSVAGSTEYWNGSNNETVWATILSQSVPTIMMDLLITRIAFRATNETLDGRPYIQVEGADGFVNIDLSRYIEHFRVRLENEILGGLSNGNTIGYNIVALINLVGETKISIGVGGGPIIDFTSPSFCDGLFAPILTNQETDLIRITDDVISLADNIGTVNMHQHEVNNFYISQQKGDTYADGI